MIEPVKQAAKIIKDAKRVLVFTGAGVSAESGIPTYRGESDGLWKEYDASIYADIRYFKKDPTYFWSFFKDVRYKTLVNSHPNAAHKAIARLEELGRLEMVVTQNIDGLHKAAGNTKIIELHGNTRTIGCLDCDAEYGFEEVYAQVQKEMPPKCKKCGGNIKPKVVFFGEAMPEGAMENAAHAAGRCDVLLVVGSTLAVYPAASIPLIAKRIGAKLIIINVGPTEMDEIADIRIDAKAGKVLPDIVG